VARFSHIEIHKIPPKVSSLDYRKGFYSFLIGKDPGNFVRAAS